MEKKFNKEQFSKNQTKLVIMCAILALIGLISIIIGACFGNTSTDNADAYQRKYYHDPKDYYGVYVGKNTYNINYKLILEEYAGSLTIGNTEYAISAQYMSATRMDKEYASDKNLPAIIIYDLYTDDEMFVFWVNKDANDDYIFSTMDNFDLTLTKTQNNT